MKKNNTTPIQTVLTITLGFLVIFMITKNEWLLYVSLVVGILGVFSNYLAEKIHVFWMKLAWFLSFIVPNILLSIVFYFFLFPIATLSKIFGAKDPMGLKNTQSSLFKTVNKEFDKSSFEKVW
jgi:hypothetical protein